MDRFLSKVRCNPDNVREVFAHFSKTFARNKTAGKDSVPYETENMIKEVLKSYIKQKHLSFSLQILEMVTTTYRLKD